MHRFRQQNTGSIREDAVLEDFLSTGIIKGMMMIRRPQPLYNIKKSLAFALHGKSKGNFILYLPKAGNFITH